MSADRRQRKRPSEPVAEPAAERPPKAAAARPSKAAAKAAAKRPAKPAAKRPATAAATLPPEPVAKAVAVRERLREQQRATYREAILSAAERIFASCGFHGVRMSDVAAEAGMATGTLYNYFESKSEVLCSLIVERGNDLLRELQALRDSECNPITRIERIVQATFDYVERHRAGYKMLSELAPPELALRQLGGPEVVEIQARYLAVVEAAMAAGLRARRLRSKFSPRDLAMFLAGAMDGMARMSVAVDDGTRLADKAGMVMELFLSGASTKP
jgi:AcrR family transcriptional regulator